LDAVGEGWSSLMAIADGMVDGQWLMGLVDGWSLNVSVMACRERKVSK